MYIDISTLTDEQLQDFDAHMTEVTSKLGEQENTGLAASVWTSVRMLMDKRGLAPKSISKPTTARVNLNSVSDDDLANYNTMMHDSRSKIASFSSLAISLWLDVVAEMRRRNGANAVSTANTTTTTNTVTTETTATTTPTHVENTHHHTHVVQPLANSVNH